MRQIQAVLTAAVLVALCVVGWQLREIRRELQPFAALSAGTVRSLMREPETRAQRNERLQQQQRDTEDDAAAILATPARPARKPIAK